jgi:hypothetical protein
VLDPRLLGFRLAHFSKKPEETSNIASLQLQMKILGRNIACTVACLHAIPRRRKVFRRILQLQRDEFLKYEKSKMALPE